MTPPPLKQHSPQQQIAHKIRSSRKAYRMTQAELARRADTTQSAIARLEAGKANPRLSTLIEISNVFNWRLEVNFRRRR